MQRRRPANSSTISVRAPHYMACTRKTARATWAGENREEKPIASGIAEEKPIASGIVEEKPIASGIAEEKPVASGIAEEKLKVSVITEENH